MFRLLHGPTVQAVRSSSTFLHGDNKVGGIVNRSHSSVFANRYVCGSGDLLNKKINMNQLRFIRLSTKRLRSGLRLHLIRDFIHIWSALSACGTHATVSANGLGTILPSLTCHTHLLTCPLSYPPLLLQPFPDLRKFDFTYIFAGRCKLKKKSWKRVHLVGNEWKQI